MIWTGTTAEWRDGVGDVVGCGDCCGGRVAADDRPVSPPVVECSGLGGATDALFEARTRHLLGFMSSSETLLRVLQQRPPWLTLERVLQHVPGEWLVAQCRPSTPHIFPLSGWGAYVLEAMGQASAVLLQNAPAYRHHLGYIVRVSGYDWTTDTGSAGSVAVRPSTAACVYVRAEWQRRQARHFELVHAAAAFGSVSAAERVDWGAQPTVQLLFKMVPLEPSPPPPSPSPSPSPSTR